LVVATGRWVLGGELSVARIGYGTMKLTGWPRGEQPSRETALAILRRAVELGVNHIDTVVLLLARRGVGQ
jgi:aryl-alcohol dehydrogenase-like predicted oxidoreductase